MDKDTTASVLAELASYGEFLPGSVRRTSEKRRRADGRIKTYEAQPIYTYTDPDTRKQVSRRIPKGCFDRVRELTTRHRGFKELVARFEAAAVRENLDDGSKKNSSRSGRASAAPTSRRS